jgi:S-adenosylmethionine-diacylglycerol 3-amino-3-carboxypropyl transferase
MATLARQKSSLGDKLDQRIFDAIYSRSLVYNTCWEDPAVDRRALTLTSDDTMLVITSAGCNVLDYALTGVRRIHAVDANPRQTALLDLKIAGIRRLDFEDFFQFFGNGHHPRARELYQFALRRELTGFSRDWWDRRIGWFSNPDSSFYYHGLSGVVARGFRRFLRLRPRLAGEVMALFDAPSVAEQRRIYDQRIEPEMWGPLMNWVLSRQLTMSLLGVPYPQRRLVQAQHAEGVAGFIRESIEYVIRELPLRDNYFWRVYVHGHYARHCCPEYLKPTNFAALKAGLIDCVNLNTCAVTDFLHLTRERLTKLVLLDHMDWMSSYHPEALVEEWNAILARAADGARVIFRSAHRDPAYLGAIRLGPQRRPLRDVLTIDEAQAKTLSRADRVHTYAGFFIGDLHP